MCDGQIVVQLLDLCSLISPSFMMKGMYVLID